MSWFSRLSIRTIGAGLRSAGIGQKWALAAIVGIVVMAPLPGNAQVLGPLLENGQFELGAQFHVLHREYKDVTRPDWMHGGIDDPDGSVYFRFGLSRTVTLSGELLVGNARAYDADAPDRRYYHVGAGAQAYVATYGEYSVTAGFHLARSQTLTRSNWDVDIEFTTLAGAVLIERAFFPFDQKVTLLAGPSYVYNREHTLGGRYNVDVTQVSVDNFGGVYGFSALLFRHYSAFFHVVYAGYHQPRFGLSYYF